MPIYSNFESGTLTDNGMLFLEEKLFKDELVMTNITKKPLLYMLTNEKREDGRIMADPSEVSFDFTETTTNNQIQRKWYPIFGDTKANKLARVIPVGRTRALHAAAAPPVTVEERSSAESYSSQWMIALEMTLLQLQESMGQLGKRRLSQNKYFEMLKMRMTDIQDRQHDSLAGTQAGTDVNITGMLHWAQNNATVHGINQVGTPGWQANVLDMGGATFNSDAFFTILSDHELSGRAAPDLAVCHKNSILARVRQVYKSETFTVLQSPQPEVYKADFTHIVVKAGGANELVFAADGYVGVKQVGTPALANAITCYRTADIHAWFMKPTPVSSGTVGGDLGFDVTAQAGIFTKKWYFNMETLCENPFNILQMQNVAPS